MVLSRAKRTPTTSIRFRNQQNTYTHYMEAYRSGHNGPHSKCGYRASGTRVRIPSLPPTSARLGVDKKRFDKNSQAFFLCFFCSRRLISFALGVRNDVAFRCTTLTAEGHGRTNPFASATKIALARALFVSSKEIRLHLCHRQHCCRTLCCMLRFACNWKNKHECFRFAFLPSLADCLAGACISHAPAKMPFEVFLLSI